MPETKATVVIRRVKKVQGGGHHGGAWKVAFADFVTAMMAFFLVLWLVAATTKEQRVAISEYFRNPSPLQGKSPAPSPGMAGPGGASTSMIKLGGTADMQRGDNKDPFGSKSLNGDTESKTAQREKEKQRLETLMRDLKEAIDKSQALEPFKDQLLLDLTPDGLRIQIVDKENRPMFDIGSAVLKPYTRDILRELSGFINEVPNRISISGHTDVTQYSGKSGYSNWELSADRANAARRELVTGGMSEDKVSRVVGLSSSILFDRQNPDNPINRRISIVVMTKDAEDAALAGSEHAVALGKPQSDADTKLPDLSAAATAAPTPLPAAATLPAPATPAAAPAASTASPATVTIAPPHTTSPEVAADAARAAIRAVNSVPGGKPRSSTAPAPAPAPVTAAAESPARR
ncbi:flagellar motor protein MotB [Xanthomonas hyacinthi]|uniref:Motility protein MotB n=1 Tax=Xanthomonas hyacinthi TaxID=56455 RepID=A0A2S7EUJ0_9XANT|nr:flagellar motor protein MotB [Xanthomonas hyacinthi]KLD78414.1 flagellar motor protein MotB [Xanthomonas hyacinthi DSM 19077]PPU96775.1 motility protein MotB [Xanthomonas hyacinthi]QGY76276.1 flagellar motor protein MotB [Xanthomonas hyacinthi]